ncbi:MAG TPA: amino acid ABC transporter permease [Acetobacteraceae bacterium]|jgi:polar amino acid transport system permease protein|nr:amino acid ABC transporter permease [Acetobacteraceae bacterium]
MGYSWDFGAVTLHPHMWLWGFVVTVSYSTATIVGGLLIGVVCGMLMLSHRWILVSPVNGFVQAFRCTPLLIQIIWFYYALPVAANITIPAWFAAALGLTFYMAAFSAEIFRGGLQSIDRGQWQAARAIGMLPWQVMHRVILPQAARRMLPPFVNQSVLQIKNTSLLSVIAVPDLMYQAQLMVSETFRPLEIYTSLGVAYFAMLYPLQKLAKKLERRDDI